MVNKRRTCRGLHELCEPMHTLKIAHKLLDAPHRPPPVTHHLPM